jgi:hypothetical protein
VPAVVLAWTQVTRVVDARKFDMGDQSNSEILANMYKWRLATAQSASR